MQKKPAVNRGLQDDPALAVGADPNPLHRTAEQKAIQLEFMLQRIATWIPVISSKEIVDRSTSLKGIWGVLRNHYGVLPTGGRFLDLNQIRFSPGERYETFFRRIQGFVDEQLVTSTCGLLHHGENITVNEDFSPTIENMVVYIWLNEIDTGLPQLVKHKYATDLRSRTLASLQPQIALAMPSLLAELRADPSVNAVRAGSGNRAHDGQFNKPRPVKACCLCKKTLY